MSFYQLVENRRSIRSYDPFKPVPKDILLRILNAGRVAPSAKNLQPWKFVIVESPEKRRQLNAVYPRGWFHKAPQVLIVVGDRDHAWVRSDGYNSIETDLTITLDHMILAAETEGVGTCWIAAFDNEKLRDLLGLSVTEEIFALTPLGYPEAGFQKPVNSPRKPLSEIVTFL